MRKVSGRFGIYFLVWALATLCFCLFSHTPALAVTGVNEQINYQARLFSSAGAVVADGTYNIEFKIYQDGTGCASAGTPPCSGSLKWTETRTGSNRVTVTNGYFAVHLGSVNSFGGTIDWNQDTLWLSINIGGTGGSPTWDGEMTPFRRLGATPYALNTKQLGGLDWSKFVQVAPSAVQTDTSNLASLAINKTGSSGAILALQKNGADVLTVANSGIVTLGTADATGAVFVLDVKNDPGDPVGTDGAMYYNSNGNKFRCYQAGAWADCIGAGGGGSTDLQGAYTNSSPATITTTDGKNISLLLADTATDANFLIDLQCDVGCASGGRFAVQDDGVDIFSIAPAGGAVTLQNSIDSTGAWTVLNASSIPQFSIDTSNSRLYVGNATADSTGALLVLDTKNTATDPSGVDGAMYYNSDSKSMRCRHNGLWQDCDFASLRAGWMIQEDFVNASVTSLTNGAQGWLGASIGTGGTVAKVDVGADASNQDRFGILQLNSPATAATGYHIRLDASGMAGTPSNLVAEFAFGPANAAAATGLQQTLRLGLHDSVNANAPTDGIYFQYSATTAAGNWFRCTRSNSVETCTSTGVAYTTTNNQYQRFRIQVNSAGTAVEFFINETSVGTNTTNLPAVTRSYGPAFNVSTVDATIRQWKIDYVQIKRNLTNLR
ncbi:MAG TPA: hypothetical protein VFT87_00810 [Candidatus Saccharimonadales bacterium]|nr:hypothetical protein [Candidatus Saccharimonadales bacterium]